MTIEYRPSGPQGDPPQDADSSWPRRLADWLRDFGELRRRDLERLADLLADVPRETVVEATIESGGTLTLAHDREVVPYVAVTPLGDLGNTSVWVTERTKATVTLAVGTLPSASVAILVRLSR